MEETVGKIWIRVWLFWRFEIPQRGMAKQGYSRAESRDHGCFLSWKSLTSRGSRKSVDRVIRAAHGASAVWNATNQDGDGEPTVAIIVSSGLNRSPSCLNRFDQHGVSTPKARPLSLTSLDGILLHSYNIFKFFIKTFCLSQMCLFLLTVKITRRAGRTSLRMATLMTFTWNEKNDSLVQ